MAHVAEPVLLRPSSVSEACLRIEQGLPGAKAIGHLQTRPLQKGDVLKMYETGEAPVLMEHVFTHVDVSAVYKRISTNPDGTPKGCGGSRSEIFADHGTVDEPPVKTPFSYSRAASAIDQAKDATPAPESKNEDDLAIYTPIGEGEEVSLSPAERAILDRAETRRRLAGDLLKPFSWVPTDGTLKDRMGAIVDEVNADLEPEPQDDDREAKVEAVLDALRELLKGK